MEIGQNGPLNKSLLPLFENLFFFGVYLHGFHIQSDSKSVDGEISPLEKNGTVRESPPAHFGRG